MLRICLVGKLGLELWIKDVLITSILILVTNIILIVCRFYFGETWVLIISPVFYDWKNMILVIRKHKKKEA
jgi:hypothetical protein